MPFFPNSSHVDAPSGTFNDVGRDQFNIQGQTNMLFHSNELGMNSKQR